MDGYFCQLKSKFRGVPNFWTHAAPTTPPGDPSKRRWEHGYDFTTLQPGDTIEIKHTRLYFVHTYSHYAVVAPRQRAYHVELSESNQFSVQLVSLADAIDGSEWRLSNAIDP